MKNCLAVIFLLLLSQVSIAEKYINYVHYDLDDLEDINIDKFRGNSISYFVSEENYLIGFKYDKSVITSDLIEDDLDYKTLEFDLNVGASHFDKGTVYVGASMEHDVTDSENLFGITVGYAKINREKFSYNFGVKYLNHEVEFSSEFRLPISNKSAFIAMFDRYESDTNNENLITYGLGYSYGF